MSGDARDDPPHGALKPSAPEDRPRSGPRQVSLARLAEFGIRPRRSLGQNFLIDDNILGVILERLQARADDVILEVGAGLGVLTQVLLDAGAVVHAFEIDRRLEPALRATVGDDPRLQVHMRDILEGPLESLAPPPTLCASNLPYNVAGPFLAESLVSLPGIRRYCVMVQREIAERLASPPGSKSYGSLSVWVQLHVEVRETRPLSRAIFYPRPHVDSSLVTMDRRDRHDLVAERPGWVRRVIDAAFAQRRKSLVNSLSSTLGTEKARVASILRTLDLPSGVRAEALAPDAFVALAMALLTLEGEPGYNVASRSGRGPDRV